MNSDRSGIAAPRSDGLQNALASLGRLLPGIVTASLLAVAAWGLGTRIPLIGGPIFAIVLGLLIAAVADVPAWKAWTAPGLRFASKWILQAAVVLLGASLQMSEVLATGVASFRVMIGSLLVAFVVAALLGRAMTVPGRLTVLIGVGTAICGGSAIAAMSPIIGAEDREIAYSMSTIFFFNVIAVLIFPAIGHALRFSSRAFGLWAGTAINDTSSVVAAGYSYSNAAGDFATVVKLTRTTMIVPIVFIAAAAVAIRSRRPGAGSDKHSSAAQSGSPRPPLGRDLLRVFPWFILGFLALSLLGTIHLLPTNGATAMSNIGRFLIVVALAAIGLGANFREMVASGVRPLLLGLSVWAAVALSSIALARIFPG